MTYQNNQNTQNTQNAQNENRVYYSKVHLMRRGKDAPISDAVFAVSGDVVNVEKKTGTYGEFLSITMEAILPDKSVERAFGPEFINPEHKVSFRFTLNGYTATDFIQRRPRWGQTIIFMLYNMRVESFQRRNGETGYAVQANCSGYTAVGSTKKPDGSDRPMIDIKGLDGAPAAQPTQGAAPNAAAPNAAQPAQNGTFKQGTIAEGIFTSDDFDDDDELPF